MPPHPYLRPSLHNKVIPAGNVAWAKLHANPPDFVSGARATERRSRRKSMGIKYEKDAHAYFSGLYGSLYRQSPWIQFAVNGGATRWCQPDAILFSTTGESATILEYKYQHVASAYDQLFLLYLPVVRILYPHLTAISCCEVVKWFDPATFSKPRAVLCPNVSVVPPNQFAVHIFRP